MHEPNFTQFEQRLLRDGIAANVASRMTDELRDHLADLEADFLRCGETATAAHHSATRALGPLDSVAQATARRPELRNLFMRYPMLGRAVLPVACVISQAQYTVAPRVARWGLFATISAAITAAMMLAMQLSITLT